jgi:hypothetical protein
MFKLNKNKILFLLLYTTIVIVLATLPVNTKGELNNINILFIRGDYAMHALLFSPFMPAILGRNFTLKNLLIVLFIGFAIASISELIQVFIPYRAFNFNDMFANCIGVAIGGSLIFIYKIVKQ